MIRFGLLSIAWGYACHYASIITADMRGGWGPITNYTIGVLATLPVLHVALRKTGRLSDGQVFIADCVYLASFVLIGAGTALGWLHFSPAKNDDIIPRA